MPPTPKQSDHQAERHAAPQQPSRSSSPGPYSHGERWSRDDEDRPSPPRREPKPAPEPKPARERTAGRHARPQQKGEARPGSQPSGQDSMIKKYWWVGALGAAGLITLVAVSRR